MVTDRACTTSRSTRSKRSRAKIVSRVTASPLVTAASKAAGPRRRSAARLSTRGGPAEAYAGSALTIVPPLISDGGFNQVGCQQQPRDQAPHWCGRRLLIRVYSTVFACGLRRIG